MRNNNFKFLKVTHFEADHLRVVAFLKESAKLNKKLIRYPQQALFFQQIRSNYILYMLF